MASLCHEIESFMMRVTDEFCCLVGFRHFGRYGIHDLEDACQEIALRMLRGWSKNGCPRVLDLRTFLWKSLEREVMGRFGKEFRKRRHVLAYLNWAGRKGYWDENAGQCECPIEQDESEQPSNGPSLGELDRKIRSNDQISFEEICSLFEGALIRPLNKEERIRLSQRYHRSMKR